MQIDEAKLEESVAYVQMMHVEPCMNGCDASSYEAHTNIRDFFYEVSVIDEKIAADAPQVARQALKRIFITGESFLSLCDVCKGCKISILCILNSFCLTLSSFTSHIWRHSDRRRKIGKPFLLLKSLKIVKF